MDLTSIQGITPPTTPAAARASSGASGDFASLLHALEHASTTPATPQQLGATLATADQAFEFAMRLRVELEHAYSRRQP